MNVILSIKPEYVAEIKARRKRFEFRKTIFKQPVDTEEHREEPALDKV